MNLTRKQFLILAGATALTAPRTPLAAVAALARPKTPKATETAGPVISRIKYATIGAPDVDAVERLYTTVLGHSVVERSKVSAPAIRPSVDSVPPPVAVTTPRIRTPSRSMRLRMPAGRYLFWQCLAAPPPWRHQASGTMFRPCLRAPQTNRFLCAVTTVLGVPSGRPVTGTGLTNAARILPMPDPWRKVCFYPPHLPRHRV